jgi:hypothetical protein
MWMRALKQIIPHKAGKTDEMFVCKLWIMVNEEAVKSSVVTVASANLEFRIERLMLVCRDSVVDTASHYGLDDPRIEPQWEGDFPPPSRPALGPTQPPVQWLTGLFSGGKAVGGWLSSPTPI